MWMTFQHRAETGSAAFAESCAFFALPALTITQKMIDESQTAPSVWRVRRAEWID
jgi:hypothetical protein